MTNNKISAHFKLKEIKCRCGCGFYIINKELLEKIELARLLACTPFIINSWCRCKAYNDSLPNSVVDSAHLKGMAVDIAIADSNKSIILKSLCKAGFKRIGIAKKFIHVDIDADKPQVKWQY